MKFTQNLNVGLLLVLVLCVCAEARPQSLLGADDKPDMENLDTDAVVGDNEGRASYYDLPMQTYYHSMPMDRLQMLFAQYRPSNFLRTPTYNSIGELYRMPETKRQVRYRQCYFNPISCFKK